MFLSLGLLHSFILSDLILLICFISPFLFFSATFLPPPVSFSLCYLNVVAAPLQEVMGGDVFVQPMAR